MAQIEIGSDQIVISGAEYRRLLAVDFGLKHRTVGAVDIHGTREELVAMIAQQHAEVERLRGAISQIHDVCIDNGVAGCDTAMALKFVRSVALQALESTSALR